MAGRKTLAITDKQYKLMTVLWQHGPITVRELMTKLPKGDKQPYTTVLGMLQNMEKSGWVAHDNEGTTYRYFAAVSQQETTGKLLRDFLDRFFGGSAESLVLGLIDAEALDAKELRELESKLSEPLPKRTRKRAKKRDQDS